MVLKSVSLSMHLFLAKTNPIMQEQYKVGLYINDDLSTFKKFSGPNIKKDKKEIIKIFKSFELSIPVRTNVKSANYLDVNFNLTPDI